MANNELVDELAYGWLEVHKKSAVTLLVLHALSREEMWSREIVRVIQTQTGWDLNERAFYRILQRLEGQGSVDHYLESGERTGVDRNIFRLTDDGAALLDKMLAEVAYMQHL